MTAPVRKESGGNAKRCIFLSLREKTATRKGRRRRALRRARSVRASRLRGTMSNKGGNKREKFLESVRKQKLDTVRWSLGAGGQSPSVRDDEGYTSIMIAAAGKPVPGGRCVWEAPTDSSTYEYTLRTCVATPLHPRARAEVCRRRIPRCVDHTNGREC